MSSTNTRWLLVTERNLRIQVSRYLDTYIACVLRKRKKMESVDLTEQLGFFAIGTELRTGLRLLTAEDQKSPPRDYRPTGLSALGACILICGGSEEWAPAEPVAYDFNDYTSCSNVPTNVPTQPLTTPFGEGDNLTTHRRASTNQPLTAYSLTAMSNCTAAALPQHYLSTT